MIRVNGNTDLCFARADQDNADTTDNGKLRHVELSHHCQQVRAGLHIYVYYIRMNGK